MKYPEHDEIQVFDTSAPIPPGWQLLDVLERQKVEFEEEEWKDPNNMHGSSVFVQKPFLVKFQELVCGRTANDRAEAAEDGVAFLRKEKGALQRELADAKSNWTKAEDKYSDLKKSHSEITSLRDEDAERVQSLKRTNQELTGNIEKIKKAIGEISMQEIINA